MTKQLYILDDSDAPFPEIKKAYKDQSGADSFSNIKKQAIKRCMGTIEHWRSLAKDFRNLKKSDVK